MRYVYLRRWIKLAAEVKSFFRYFSDLTDPNWLLSVAIIYETLYFETYPLMQVEEYFLITAIAIVPAIKSFPVTLAIEYRQKIRSIPALKIRVI